VVVARSAWGGRLLKIPRKSFILSPTTERVRVPREFPVYAATFFRPAGLWAARGGQA